MSIDPQGMSRSYCVWKWHSGFESSHRPAIHILEGLKVCIQVMTPAQDGSALAARTRARMASGLFRTGFQTMRQGRATSSPSTIAFEVAVHPGEGILTVEVLAAGHEPDIPILKIAHRITPLPWLRLRRRRRARGIFCIVGCRRPSYFDWENKSAPQGAASLLARTGTSGIEPRGGGGEHRGAEGA